MTGWLRFAVAAALCISSNAATPLAELRYSPDITVVLAASTVDDEDIATDDLAGLVSTVDVGAIPASADVIGYHRLASGDQLLSFDTSVALPGGLTAFAGDVVLFDGTSYTIVFDAAANGVPAGAVTDAVAALSVNDLLLSFDTTVSVGEVVADDEDIVRFNRGTVSLFFDGSAEGVTASLDLDAVHCLDSPGSLLLSFDGSGTVGGATFDDEDVLEFTPATGVWELVYDGSAQHGGWAAADLNAVYAATDPPSGGLPPALDGSSGGLGGNGLDGGTDRVFGVGTVHGKPGDTCIEIYEVGPNGVRDDKLQIPQVVDCGTQSATHSNRLPTMSKAPSADTQSLRDPVATATSGEPLLQSVVPLSRPGSGVPITAACHSAFDGSRLRAFLQAACA
jgi:hypothetical protein